jgi:rhodanese-related sulfurtransferase
MKELDPNQWIIAYCSWSSDQTSARVALVLLQNGFNHVTALGGGYAGWINAGYPTEPWSARVPIVAEVAITCFS